MVKQFIFFFILIQFFIYLLIFPSFSEKTNRIIAIVNNQPITSLDIEHRINLLLYKTNLEINSKNKDQFYKDALNNLIDDELKLQEGVKFGKSLIEQASLATMKVENSETSTGNNNKKGFVINCKLKAT